jgi:hypothetical protein
MGRVLTNNISLLYGLQSAIDVDPTEWRELEPNGISSYGAEITTVARDPISKSRSRRKGTTVDLDSGAEIDQDLTLDTLEDFAEGFLFASGYNMDLIFEGSDAGASGYTVAALTAAQGAKLQYTSGGPISLLYARGYVNAANNGLQVLSADAASTDTTLQVSGLTTETAPANARVEVAGIRPEVGDLSLTVSAGVGTLTSGNNGAANNIDFTTLGLQVGQFIHIGGLTGANQFSAGAGYGRIITIAAGTITLDKLSTTLATDTGAGETVDLLYGQFVRNVDVDDASYLEQYYQLEAAFPNLGAGGVTEYYYSINNLCNQLAFSLPLTDKATVTAGFIGTDTEVPTTSRKTGASSAVEPIRTGAFNTSADIGRLRIIDTDETGLTTDFKSMTLTIDNQVSPEKVLGNLGARYMNVGNLQVTLETQIVFTNADVIDRIRENTTVAFDFLLTNDDGGFIAELPSLTLGGGDLELPINESVLLNIEGETFNDPVYGYSMGISTFPVLP